MGCSDQCGQRTRGWWLSWEHVQGRSSAPSAPNRISSCEKKLFTLNAHWMVKRSFFTPCQEASGVTWSQRCWVTHLWTRVEDFLGQSKSARCLLTRFPQRIRSAPCPLPQRLEARVLLTGCVCQCSRSCAERGGGREDPGLGRLVRECEGGALTCLLDHTGQVRQSHSRAVFLALASALLHY